MTRKAGRYVSLGSIVLAGLLAASLPAGAQVCGNGAVECPSERCDDGNLLSSDACLATCEKASCGDGFLCSDASCTSGPNGCAEACDDGNDQDDVTCCADCSLPPCGEDDDGDGELVPGDNCPGTANPGQQDTDGDGVGDACDNCRGVANATQEDDDDDHIGNDCDNCVNIANPSQADTDQDGEGDACVEAERRCIAAKMKIAAKYAAGAIKCTAKDVRKGSREEEECRQREVERYLAGYQKKIEDKGCDPSDVEETRKAAEATADAVTKGTVSTATEAATGGESTCVPPKKPTAKHCLYRIDAATGTCPKGIRQGALVCLDCPSPGACPPTTIWKLPGGCSGKWRLYSKDCVDCPRDAIRGLTFSAG